MKNNILFPLVLVLLAANLGSIFFEWLRIEVSAGLDLGFLSSEFSLTEETVKGIHVPGGIVGLVLPVFLLFVFYRYGRVASLFALVMLLNGLGYAFGWFINEESYFAMDLATDIADASLQLSPQPGLIVYLASAALLFILCLFKKNE